MAITESLIELFSRGGPVMFGIAGVSLVAWILSLRTWSLAGSMLKKLQKINLVECRPFDLGSARKLPQNYLSSGSSPSSSNFSDSISASYDFHHLAIKAQAVRLGSNLWLIGTLAAVLPLLGLLGTVLGMLLSFEVIQSYGTSQPRLLAGGIGQALITTQAGLWTAVPVFFFYHIIRRRVNLIRNETEMMFHMIQKQFLNRVADGIKQVSNSRGTRQLGE